MCVQCKIFLFFQHLLTTPLKSVLALVFSSSYFPVVPAWSAAAVLRAPPKRTSLSLLMMNLLCITRRWVHFALKPNPTYFICVCVSCWWFYMHPFCFYFKSNCRMTISLFNQVLNDWVRLLGHTTLLRPHILQLDRWLVCVAFHLHLPS